MNILIAIDQSAFASDVVDFIGRHRWTESENFTVVHVVDSLLVGSHMSFLPSPVLDDIKDKAREQGRKAVHQAAERLRQLFPDASVAEEILEGFVVDSIVDFASSWPAEIVVIGSHGHRGSNKFTLGSVARSVSSQAQCSVLIVNSHSDKKTQ